MNPLLIFNTCISSLNKDLHPPSWTSDFNFLFSDFSLSLSLSNVFFSWFHSFSLLTHSFLNIFNNFRSVDKALEEREKVSKSFFDVVESKGVREAVASLPKDAEITGGIDGPLRVNGKTNDDFHARGCPFETEIGGVKYIVDGTADYDGFSNACAGLKFDGTITKNTKKQKEVYRFHFEYRHVYESIDELRWWYDSEDEVDYDDGELNEMAMDNIVSNYEFGFIE